MMATAGIGYGSRGLYAGQSSYANMYSTTGPTQSQGGEVQESTYLYIPNNAVGAIIGTKVCKKSICVNHNTVCDWSGHT